MHNRTICFPCNFGWWRQQQTTFFQVKTSNFLSESFKWTATTMRSEVEYITNNRPDELLTKISHTLYGIESTGKILNFVSASLAILYISICFPVLVSQLKREYFMLSNQQTGSTEQLKHLESFFSASKAKDSSLVYNSRLSFVLSYQPIRF